MTPPDDIIKAYFIAHGWVVLVWPRRAILSKRGKSFHFGGLAQAWRRIGGMA